MVDVFAEIIGDPLTRRTFKVQGEEVPYRKGVLIQES